jgi:hypothetical protein
MFAGSGLFPTMCDPTSLELLGLVVRIRTLSVLQRGCNLKESGRQALSAIASTAGSGMAARKIFSES